MALCPFAIKKLIAPGENDPAIEPTQVILHVAVSEGESLHDYFANRSGGVESHFYVRRDGVIEQYRDTAFEADANYTANRRAISIETQGMGPGEWTYEQLRAIKQLLLWAKRTHGVPLRRCPRHDAPGVGYHVMFGAPGPWTPHVKSCPGPDRIRQFNEVLVPWMASLKRPVFGKHLRHALQDLREARAYAKGKGDERRTFRVQKAMDWINKIRGQ